jgi:hypothetical protein
MNKIATGTPGHGINIPDPRDGIIGYASSWASLKFFKLHIEAFSPPEKEMPSFSKPEVSLFFCGSFFY